MLVDTHDTLTVDNMHVYQANMQVVTDEAATKHSVSNNALMTALEPIEQTFLTSNAAKNAGGFVDSFIGAAQTPKHAHYSRDEMSYGNDGNAEKQYAVKTVKEGNAEQCS